VLSRRAAVGATVLVFAGLIVLYVTDPGPIAQRVLSLLCSGTALLAFQAVARYNTRVHAALGERLRGKQDALLAARRSDALGRFAGGVAHDFNNLLTIIGSHASLLRVSSDGADLDTSLTAIDVAVNDATDLTSQLLAYGRRQVLYPEVIDVAQIVARIEPTLRRLVGEEIDLRVTLSTASAPVLMDPNQLPRILMNLAANARDAMPDGGSFEVELRCERDGGRNWVVLEAKDDGPGMTTECRDRAFDPFYTTKRSGRSTGLGLATAHGIVLQSEGEIAIDSTVGGGTTVRIRLPRSKELPTPKEVPVVREMRTRKEILLVEDEPRVRRIADRILSKTFNVTAYDNAEVALLALRADPLAFDVILTDIVMPGLSGTDLVYKARALGVDAAFVVMSGYAPERAPGGSLPPDCFFLAKPFNPEELVRVVTTASAIHDSDPSGYPAIRKIEVEARRSALVEAKEPAMASA